MLRSRELNVELGALWKIWPHRGRGIDPGSAVHTAQGVRNRVSTERVRIVDAATVAGLGAGDSSDAEACYAAGMTDAPLTPLPAAPASVVPAASPIALYVQSMRSIVEICRYREKISGGSGAATAAAEAWVGGIVEIINQHKMMDFTEFTELYNSQPITEFSEKKLIHNLQTIDQHVQVTGDAEAAHRVTALMRSALVEQGIAAAHPDFSSALLPEPRKRRMRA